MKGWLDIESESVQKLIFMLTTEPDASVKLNYGFYLNF